MATDWKKLWQRVMDEFQCDPDSIHGPAHWRRVERNGLLLAECNGGEIEVVKLFALFHDSRRADDGNDPGHGERGAKFAAQFRGVHFDLPDTAFALLLTACEGHTQGFLSDDATIAACWDADRLDLWRVGTKPSPRFMSTELAKKIAEKGTVELYLERAARRT